MTTYRWQILQQGRLPLRPDGATARENGHRCTSMLLWPAGEKPGRDNTLVTDPCLDMAGLAMATATLRQLDLRWEDVGHGFCTHPHHDHLSNLMDLLEHPLMRPELGADGPLGGLRTEPLPGHEQSQRALVFSDGGGEVWVAGDAVLDQVWLRAWAYYWPNHYTPEEVAQTWRSVGRVLASADLVVPGHGAPFRVTATLLDALLRGFPGAPHAELCPELPGLLRARLIKLEDPGRLAV